MNEAKHTPGPWKTKRDRHNRHRFEVRGKPDGHLTPCIAITASWLDSDPESESAANARLIAAAPDLLEALREYVDQDFMACGYDSGIGGTTQSKAEAAIAKATNGTA